MAGANISNESQAPLYALADTRLPFETDTGDWAVPRPKSYVQACNAGREFAAHFALMLKANPGFVEQNTLGRLACSINFDDESDSKGYWVGFFAHLERLIFLGSKRLDVFADVVRIEAEEEAAEAAEAAHG